MVDKKIPKKKLKIVIFGGAGFRLAVVEELAMKNLRLQL